MSLRLTFHGAAGTVTGSCMLLETSAGSLLVDCGLANRDVRLHAFDISELESAHLSAPKQRLDVRLDPAPVHRQG